MLSLQAYEQRVASLKMLHPELPDQAVTLVRMIGFLQRRLEDALQARLADRQLTHSQWALLMLIYSDPAQCIHPSCASEVLRQSRPHMTRMTDELVARGWVERVREDNDRRTVKIRLLPAGQAAIASLLPVMWQCYEQLTGGIAEDEVRGLDRLLRQWLLALESSGGEGLEGTKQ